MNSTLAESPRFVLVDAPTPIPSPIGAGGLIDAIPWTDIASFWVNLLGTLATVAIAVAAIWISARTARNEKEREESNARKEQEREDRATRERQDRLAWTKREEWAKDYCVWMDSGRRHMFTGGEHLATDPEWLRAGADLSARAQLMSPDSGNEFLVAAKIARERIKNIADDEVRLEAAIFAGNLLKLWARNWAKDPTESDVDIVPWIDHIASGSGSSN